MGGHQRHGDLLAIGGRDGVVNIFRISTRNPLHTLRQHDGAVTCIHLDDFKASRNMGWTF